MTSKEKALSATVDRGWAWIVLAAVAMQQMIGSTIYMSGLFNVAFLTQFELSRSTTAWIGSLHAGLFALTGPLSSVLISGMGARRTVLLGTCLIMAGYFLAAFAQSFLVICITYGVLAGIGMGLTYLPGVVMMGFYFDKYRNLAFGLVTMCVGIGQMWLAPLMSFLISYYGWRGTCVILSGIVAHFAITGAVLRPVDWEQGLADESSAATEESKMSPSSQDEDVKQTNGVPICVQNENCSNNSPGGTQPMLPHDVPTSQASLNNGHKAAGIKTIPRKNMPKHIRNNPDKFHSSASIYLGGSSHSIAKNSHFPVSQSSFNVNNLPASPCHPRLQLVLDKSSILARMSSDYIGRSYSSINSLAHTEQRVVESDVNQSVLKEEESYVTKLQQSLLLIGNIRFALYCLNVVMVCLGQSCVYFHLPAYAISMGTSPAKASNLLAAMGLANIISRFLSGVITSGNRCTPLMVFNVSLALNGVCVLLAPAISASYAGQMVTATTFSLFGNCYCAVMTPLAIELVGLQGLSAASGILLFGSGIGFLCGPPIAGLLFDITGSYTTTFYFAGSSVLIGVLFMLPLPYLTRQKTRELNNLMVP